MPTWPNAGQYIEALIDSSTGDPILSGSYFIYEPDGITLATIFTDEIRTANRPQPLTTSSDGDAEFFAEPGHYILKAAASSKNIRVLPDTDDLVLLLTALQNIGDNQLNAHVLTGYRNQVVEYGSTTYTYATATDCNATVLLNNASPISAPLPLVAQPGEGFEWVQKGLGQITFSAASPATLKNAHGHAKSFGQDAVGYIECTSANVDGTSPVWRLSGDTTA